MKLTRGFWAKADGGEAEILLYETIGKDWYGGISAKRFKDELTALGNVTTLTVRINSPGGDVFDGTAIYNTLVQHKAVIHVRIDGLAASIASLIAMAGNTIEIAENGMLMVHQASAVVIGNKSDMRKMADILDKVDDNIVSTYVGRTEQEEGVVRGWMNEETWFTGQEAVDAGFATSVLPVKAVDNAFDLSRFRNAPTRKEAEFIAEQQLHQMRLRLAMAMR